MKSPRFAPRKLDVGAFIDAADQRDGDVPASDLVRLASGLARDTDLAGLAPIKWSAHGRLVPQRGGAPQRWLDLRAQAELPWECQRCLHPVVLPIEFSRSIRFVSDESVAAQLDAESDEDVLVAERQFDLLELIEDELIMAQPLVPRHETCPVDVAPFMRPAEPLAEVPAGDEGGADSTGETASGRPNPFAVLANLKKCPS